MLQPELTRHGFTPALMARAEVVHAPQTVVMEDKATCILKEKKDSSIRVAAQLVREGRAHGVVSMGHTGAAMVASSLVIGKLEGVDVDEGNREGEMVQEGCRLVPDHPP